MKALVALVGLITASLHSGEGANTVRIRAYTATGEVAKMPGTVPQGTRVLFTCDVGGLPEGQVAVSYKWYRSTTAEGRSEIQEDDPYYTAVNDTLLVDTTSWGGIIRRHICEVDTVNDFFNLRLTDSSTPFILTPTSLLPKHALITDAKQITGRNGQQWINCTSGRNGENVQILSVVDRRYSVGGRMNTAIIGKGRYPRHNGLYYCSAGQTSFYHFSFFLRNSSNLSTPIISVPGNATWTFTSLNGSQVKRYIVEFKCRVRNITFVEKYMSVGAHGGTGRVPTRASCLKGLGQLYRLKVWAVSGPNISRLPAVKCLTPDQQGIMEGGSSTASPSTDTTMKKSDISSSTQHLPSTEQAESDSKSEGKHAGFGTFIGVGIGIGMPLLIVVLALVGVIVVVVMVKRRAANKQMGSVKMKENPSYYNPVVVKMEVKGLGYDYEDVDKDKANGSILPDFDPYEDVESKAQIKNTKKPAPKESSTPASDTNVGELYVVVDKSKKKGAKQKQEEDGCTVTTKDDLYTVPMKKSKMRDERKTASGHAEKSEDYDDVAELKYKPKVDIESGKPNEERSESPKVDMLYAAVDKNRKKKK